MIIPNLLKKGYLELLKQLIIDAAFMMTLKAAKSAPFIHLLRYFISVVRLSGASVYALASGM